MKTIDTIAPSKPLQPSSNLRRPPCADARAVFHHPLLEESPSSRPSADDRRFFDQIRNEAAEVCRACPLLTQCLYSAVVEHDVAGYVAGTFPDERRKLRRRLAVTVAPENLDTFTGAADGRVVERRRAEDPKPTRADVLDALITMRAGRPRPRRPLAAFAG